MPYVVTTSDWGRVLSLALYRTYRPAQLSEVIGQEHVTIPLGRAIDADQVHHAYLFTGPRGCGKTSTARILARSLNCVQGPTSTPCGVCDSCTELAPTGGGSIDVLELDAATNRGIDDARDLREKAAYAPVRDRYKVYILDEAHQLTTEAANALLKLIEEPPPHMRFVLATTEPDKIPATIRSRTHHYPFRLVSARRLQDNLASICARESRGADPAALALVAAAAQGSVRDAQSILGQLLAGAGTGDLTLADATDQLGVTDTALLDGFVTAVAARDSAALFMLVGTVVDSGADPRRFATDVLRRYRDLLVCKHVPDAIDRGLLDLPEEQGDELKVQQALYSVAGLTRAADLVSVAVSELKGATAPRLQLELLAARLLIPEVDESDAGVIERLETLERSASAGGPRATAGPAAGPVSEAPRPPARTAPPPPTRPATSDHAASRPPAPPRRRGDPVAAQEDSGPESATPVAIVSAPTAVSFNAVVSAWAAVLESVQARSRVVGMMMQGARPVSLDGSALVVAHPDPNRHRALLTHGNHPRLLEESLTDALGSTIRVEVILDAAAPADVTSGGRDDDVHDSDDGVVDDTSPIALVQRELGGSVLHEFDQQ